MTRVYATPLAFREAVEARLKAGGTSGFTLQRRRQSLVYQRYLARIDRAFGSNIILKGGLALEIRLAHARSTRDVDLALLGSHADLLSRLQAAGQLDLSDFMTFEVQENNDRGEVTGDGVIHGGKRFRVECRLAGKIYGARFGLDVVFGADMVGVPTLIKGDDFLGFAGIEPPTLRVLPVETHVAEKLHAYTIRATGNSRVRDLPDLALLATDDGPLTCEKLRAGIHETFTARKTHDPPATLPLPPEEWREHYERLAKEQSLTWTDLDVLFAAVEAFLNPVLGGSDCGVWDRETWTWESAGAGAAAVTRRG